MSTKRIRCPFCKLMASSVEETDEYISYIHTGQSKVIAEGVEVVDPTCTMWKEFKDEKVDDLGRGREPVVWNFNARRDGTHNS